MNSTHLEPFGYARYGFTLGATTPKYASNQPETLSFSPQQPGFQDITEIKTNNKYLASASYRRTPGHCATMHFSIVCFSIWFCIILINPKPYSPESRSNLKYQNARALRGGPVSKSVKKGDCWGIGWLIGVNKTH